MSNQVILDRKEATKLNYSLIYFIFAIFICYVIFYFIFINDYSLICLDSRGACDVFTESFLPKIIPIGVLLVTYFIFWLIYLGKLKINKEVNTIEHVHIFKQIAFLLDVLFVLMPQISITLFFLMMITATGVSSFFLLNTMLFGFLMMSAFFSIILVLFQVYTRVKKGSTSGLMYATRIKKPFDTILTIVIVGIITFMLYAILLMNNSVDVFMQM